LSIRQITEKPLFSNAQAVAHPGRVYDYREWLWAARAVPPGRAAPERRAAYDMLSIGRSSCALQPFIDPVHLHQSGGLPGPGAYFSAPAITQDHRMTPLRTLCFALACCVALAACDQQEPTFDASSIPAYQKSLAAIKAKLSAQDRQKLQVALLTLSAGGFAFFTAFALSDPAKTDAYESLDGLGNGLMLLDRMRSNINGKTAAEVIRRVADDIDYTIARAEAQGVVGSAKDLNGIVIENPRYRLSDARHPQPQAEFSVYNGSKIAISSIFLAGVLTAPGVKEPLVFDNLTHGFTPPLQPGAQQQVSISLNLVGPWTTEHFQKAYDADLKLKVANVIDPSGKILLTVSTRALDTLRHKREVLRGS
jgi:hypothetical protein